MISIPAGSYDGTSAGSLFEIPLVINADTEVETDETIIFNIGVIMTDDPTVVPVEVTEPNLCSNATGSQATHTITDVPPVPPVADDDVLSGLDTGTAGVIDPLGNDADPDGTLDPTTVALTDPAATDTNGDGFPDTLVVAGEGTWTVDPTTGEVTFTPEADSVSYTHLTLPTILLV